MTGFWGMAAGLLYRLFGRHICQGGGGRGLGLFGGAVPEAAHFGAGGEEEVEGAGGDDAAFGQDEDLVGAAEGGAAVGDGQAGLVGGGEEAFPEEALGFHIEGAGEVVYDQQFGGADKHPGGGGALGLAAGELDAARAD